MSSTRRVESGTRRSQNGWASAVELSDLRGLSGTAVSFKLALVCGDARRRKELLLFLQALSQREGGVKRIARELLEMFPERLGTETMIAIGCKAGMGLTREQRKQIARELGMWRSRWDLTDFVDECSSETDRDCSLTSEVFVSKCQKRAESLDEFIEALCCDPKLEVARASESDTSYQRIVAHVLEDAASAEIRDEAAKWEDGYRCAELEYFHDILGTLLEFKSRYEDRARADYVKTTIGEKVFEALDYSLLRKSVAMIGNSGVGKSEACKAWSEMHLGRVRLVKLCGITHRTGFFQGVAKALGVARGSGLSSSKIQMRVETFLQRTGIMLILDEGQYLLQGGNRVSKPPELINWLNTALHNDGIRFAISATDEFRGRLRVVEKNTTWLSEQLKRRVHTIILPDKPTEADLRAVAQKLLPEQAGRMIDYVVGYALLAQGFQSVRDVADDARLIAFKAGREKPSFADVLAAVLEWRSPSDAAMQRVFASEPEDIQDVAEDGNIGASEPPEEASHGRGVVPAPLPQDRCVAAAIETLCPVPG